MAGAEDFLFTGDDGDMRKENERPSSSADVDVDRLHELASRDHRDIPDGGTFADFQDAAELSNSKADARDMEAAAEIARQAVAEQQRLERQVNQLMQNSDFEIYKTIMDIQAFYLYMRRTPAEQAVINRYILGYLDPQKCSSLVPPYGQPYIPNKVMQQNRGGYKSKSKSKKYRYKKKSKKSKTNKKHRSRSKSLSKSRKRN